MSLIGSSLSKTRRIRNVEVANWDDDEDIEPRIFTREEWIHLGRAIGRNTTITRLGVSVVDQDDAILSDQVRSGTTSAQDWPETDPFKCYTPQDSTTLLDKWKS